MAADLYHGDAYFRGVVDECCAIVNSYLGIELKRGMFGSPQTADDALLTVAQPALFTVEYALARLYTTGVFSPARCLDTVSIDRPAALESACERNWLLLTGAGAMQRLACLKQLSRRR